MAVYKKIQQSKPSYPHLESLLTVSFIIPSLGLVAQSVEQRIEKNIFRCLTDSEADEYPVEDEEQEPLVVNQHFNLLETIEDEVLLSLPLIPKHPDGFCEPHASTFGGEADEELSNEQENPFNILKNMKKN